jgi:hypothetical protein
MQHGSMIRAKRQHGPTFGSSDGGSLDRMENESIAEWCSVLLRSSLTKRQLVRQLPHWISTSITAIPERRRI